MHIVESILEQIGENERQLDFYKAVLFRQANKIKFHFESNPHLFFDIPKQFARFLRKKDPSLKQRNWMFSHLKWFNSVGIDAQQIKAIFGRKPGKRTPYHYKPDVSDLAARKFIQIIPHGHVTLVSADGRTATKVSYPSKYLIPESVMLLVFTDKKLLEQILDLKSGLYSRHLASVLKRQFLKYTGPQQGDIHDLPVAEVSDVKDPKTDYAEYGRSQVISQYLAGKLLLEHAEKLYRMFDKDHILPSLKRSCVYDINLQTLAQFVQLVEQLHKRRLLVSFDVQDEHNLAALKHLVSEQSSA